MEDAIIEMKLSSIWRLANRLVRNDGERIIFSTDVAHAHHTSTKQLIEQRGILALLPAAWADHSCMKE